MSLVCYDFQKWTIISMAAVALSLTIGLVSIAYGHHSVGNSQPENPHNPNNYTFTLADIEHCTNYYVALVDDNLELCKELGWSNASGEWDNPYLHKDEK